MAKKSRQPFPSMEDARDAIINKPKVKKVLVHYAQRLAAFVRIEPKSIAETNPPPNELRRISGIDKNGQTVKFGLMAGIC